MLKQKIYINSSDKKNRLMLYSFMPEGGAFAIVQMVHGMAEHMGRYEEFASFLCDRGIGLIGHDQLGHGKSAMSTSQLGYFALKKGDKLLVNDAMHVTDLIRKKYPGVKLIMFGNSMGSFELRCILNMHRCKADAAVIMSTGSIKGVQLAGVNAAAVFLKLVKGSFYRSPFLRYLMLDSNKRYFDDYACHSWMSTDEQEVQRFEDDPLCGFSFTVSACHDIFKLMSEAEKKRSLAKLSPSFPILFVSGEDDSVGEFGKGVRRVFLKYKAQGMKKLDMILYPGLRHDILHEVDREKIFADIYDWIKELC